LPDPFVVYTVVHMKQVLVLLDDEVAARLEAIAPARSRRRSEFIRLAIRKALWDAEEEATAAAYRRQPDSVADAYLAARVWERTARRGRRRARR
jgi:predicted transcriptional regulator